jgi:hypothetical protein
MLLGTKIKYFFGAFIGIIFSLAESLLYLVLFIVECLLDIA